MKAAAPLLVLAVTGIALPAAWLHNARERTAAGMAAWKRHQYADADRSLEQALDLGGESARTLYNAGTGRLGAGAPGAALTLLAKSAKTAEGAKDPADAAVRADALYNLGNAAVAANDLSAAVDAYEASLRARPGFRPAQHNLELALRQMQKSAPQPQQQQQPGGNQGQGQGQGGQGGGEGQQQQQPSPQGNGGNAGGASGQNPQQQPQSSGAHGSPQLPHFNAQKDMSAQQAAALLAAVENLEREQRRQQAEAQRQARAKETTEQDW